ncbi:hypothetical protein [Actinoallomurus sp. CA-150999]|uniref:hypothetical protein n=1 Tax=Actinoallomurus sp. CA-150999 TaxID=3239887 RepID=UPI003D8CDE30
MVQSTIRVAVVTGAIASIAAVLAPAAGADTAGTTKAAPVVRSAMPVQAAAAWRNCQFKKPQVCGKQSGSKFQGRAKNNSRSTIKGRMGVRLWNPATGTGSTKWNATRTKTLKPGESVNSWVVKCPKGWTAQGVWDAKPGANWYSAPYTCK